MDLAEGPNLLGPPAVLASYSHRSPTAIDRTRLAGHGADLGSRRRRVHHCVGAVAMHAWLRVLRQDRRQRRHRAGLPAGRGADHAWRPATSGSSNSFPASGWPASART